MLSYLYSHATPHRLCGRQSGSQAALVCMSAYAYVVLAIPSREAVDAGEAMLLEAEKARGHGFRWGFQPPRLAWQGYEQLASE